MPYKLTQEEKEALRAKYRENVTTLNGLIPPRYRDGFSFKDDEAAFNKSINDPNKEWIYKRASEVRAREEKKKEIQERLNKELADYRIPGKVYPLERWMHTELIPSDDPEAEEYNKQKMITYFQHPEAVTQRRIQELLESDMSELNDIAHNKNVDSQMVVWADKHSGMLEGAFEAFGTMANYKEDVLTPEMQRFKGSVLINYEVAMDTSELNKRIDEAYFTLPFDMTDQQENILGGVPEFERDHQELSHQLIVNPGKKQLAAQKKAGMINFFKQLKAKNVDVKGPGALTGYVVETGNPNKPYASLGSFAKGDAGANARARRLTPEEPAGFKKVFKIDYTKEPGYKEPEIPEKFKGIAWEKARDDLLFKYAVKFDKPMHEMDERGLGAIAEHFKGGIGERLFRTTSHQYNNFIQAMQDFEKPNHVNYHNSKPGKMAANDYLIHKGVKTREEAMRLPSPGKERALLCIDTIDSFQKAEPAAEDKMIPGTKEVLKGPYKEWPPAIEDKALVEDNEPMFGDMFEEKEPAPEIEEQKEIQEPQAPEKN